MYSQFSGTTSWSLYTLKRILILELSVQNLLIPTANLHNYSWATILSWLSLPNVSINYFLMELKTPIFWNIIFSCCSFLTDVTMTPGFDQKVQKSFAACIYPHLTLSALDRMMSQSFLVYLNLLHAQRQGNLVLFKMNRIWNGQGCWKDSKVWKGVGSWKYCKLVQVYLPAFETWYFPFVSFLTPFCWWFLATLVLQTKV